MPCFIAASYGKAFAMRAVACLAVQSLLYLLRGLLAVATRGLQPRVSIPLLSATTTVAKGNKINIRGCKPQVFETLS